MRKNIFLKGNPVRRFLFAFVFMTLCGTLFAQRLPKSFASDAAAGEITPKGNTVEKVLLVNDTIWIATSKGLSKSTDRGSSWINYYGTPPFGTESVSAVAYGNGIIAASTWHFESTSQGRLPVGTGIKVSTNYGKSWISGSQPLDLFADTLVVYGNNRIKALPVTTEVQNFIRDIAIINNTIWVVSNSSGLRKSSDFGATWERVPLPPDNLDSIKPSDQLIFQLRPKAGSTGNLNHIGFSILNLGRDTLYVGTAGGINKSIDGGISWTKFSHQNQRSPISGNHILKIRQNPFDKSIWAATWKAESQEEFWSISYTRDGGETWKTALNDSRTLDILFPEIKSGSTVTGTDIIAVTQDGLYRSSNNGITWVLNPKISDSNRNITLLSDLFLGGAVDNSKTPAELWFGTGDGLVRLKQLTSNFWQGEWTIFFASEQLKGADDSYAFPNPFPPGGTVRIKYSLKSAANVTIRIFDFGMNLVRTVIQNLPRNAGESFDIWNGRDEAGSLVPNGLYFYRIDINNEKPLYGKIMAVR